MTTTERNVDPRVAAASQYYELFASFAPHHGGTKSLEMLRAREMLRNFIRNSRHEVHPIATLVAVAGIAGIMSKFVGADPNTFDEVLEETCGNAAVWLEEHLGPEECEPEELRMAFNEELGANAALEAMPPVDGRMTDNVIELHH